MKIILVFLTLFISACSSSSNSNESTTPTSPTLDFKLRSDALLTFGTQTTRDFSGSLDTGERLTGTVTNTTSRDTNGNDEVFEIITTRLNIFIDGDNPTISQQKAVYKNNFQFLVSYGLSNEIYLADTFTLIPFTAKIGESGQIGIYTSDLDFTDTRTWALTDAGNGLASLTFTTTTFDNIFNTLFSTTTEVQTIDVNANIISSQINVVFDDGSFFNININ